MANLLQQYGIKEVADVTIYQINSDNTYTPVLFLDTLKVSTVEQTAEQTEARGGKGNSPLIIWDYGKEITVTLEDALYSPQSMAIMFGCLDRNTGNVVTETVSTVTKMQRVTNADKITDPSNAKFYDANMSLIANSGTTVPTNAAYVEQTLTAKEGIKLTIDAETFPGTYRLVGDTYARNRKTGKDEYFQFEIPQAKMDSENTITLEAEGDPSVFNMTMRVLRPDDGKMMKLTQYSIG
jgi:hypothetical protein